MIDSDTFDRICEQIADGRSLRAILREDEGMPASSSVFKALAEDKAFVERYARAREAQGDKLFDEIVSIADEETLMSKRDGEDVEVVFDSTAVARNRLRIDARKWVAGKLRPKVYGDKIEHEHGGNVGLTVNVVKFGGGDAAE